MPPSLTPNAASQPITDFTPSPLSTAITTRTPVPSVPVNVATPAVADEASDPIALTPTSVAPAQAKYTQLSNAPWKTNNRDPDVVNPDGTVTKGKDHYSKWDKLAHFLEGWTTGGLGGGIAAERDRHYTERPGRQQGINEALQNLNVQQNIGAYNSKIADTAADNETNAQKVVDLAKAKTETQRGLARRSLARKQTFNPNNPADVSLAMSTGDYTPEQVKTLPSWDYSKPTLQKSGADTYQWDKELGAWKPSGLPTDKAKALNPYEITEDDAQGNQHVIATYYLNDDQASRLQQQKELQGQRLQAAKEMQSSRESAQDSRQKATQTFQIGQAATHTLSMAQNAIGQIAARAPKGAKPDQVLAKQHAYWAALSPEVQAKIPEPK